MNKLLEKLQPVIRILKRYYVIIFVLIVGSVYGYIIMTSSNLVKVEPSENQISQNYKGTKRPKIDKGATNKLNELVDRSVTLKTLIDDARNNPFQE